MANNIAVSITADVADLTAKRAIMSAELKAATKDLNDFAKTARSGGMTDELRASMLKAGDAVAKAKSQVVGISEEMKKLGDHAGGAGKALENIFDRSRLATLEEGSAKIPIFGSALEALGPAGLAAAAGVAALGISLEEAHKAMELTDQLYKQAKVAHVTTDALQEYQFGLRATGGESSQAGAALQGFSETLGKAQAGLPKAQRAFLELGFTKAQIKDFADAGTALDQVVARIGQLKSPAQKDAVIAQLGLKELKPLIEAGAQKMAELRAEAHSTGNVIDADIVRRGHEMNEQSEVLNSKIKNELTSAFINLGPIILMLTKLLAGMATLAHQISDGLSGISGKSDKGLEARARTVSAELQILKNAQAHGVHESPVAIAAKEKELADIAAERQRRAANNSSPPIPTGDASLVDLSKPPKGPDVVSVWTQQLHAQEIASGEFFKDQTQAELTFWQSKVAHTTAGSKDWLAVQEKIFTAQKALARQGYQDHLATLNEQLEADHASWSKEQADWNAKLEFIKAHYGAESAEYKNAHREFERAERDHEQRMTQIRHDAAQADLTILREALRTEHEIRQADARTQEALIKSRAQSSANPFADVAAEQQIAQLQKRAIQEQIEALGQEYLAQSQITARELAETKAALGEETEQYHKLLAEKSKLDSQYYNQRRVLVDQAANQEMQAQLRVQQAWHSNIDPMVQAAGSALQGLVEGTMTWRQALTGIGEALIGVVIGALEKVAEQMIVNAIMAKTTQVATAQTGILASAAQAGAAGIASMAGAPFPIDLGAPAFGASMAAAAAAFSVAGFAKGIDVVPQDMIAQIHAGERIVPAADNRAIMSAVGADGGAGGGGARRARDGGGMHLHFHPPGGMGRNEIERHAQVYVDTLKSALRKDPALRRQLAAG